MSITKQIAEHFRSVHFGGNWTAVNLKDTLADISWQQAIAKVEDLNSIATLLFHINYYVAEVLKVLQGESLMASDKYSFDTPSITSAQDWERLIAKVLTEAELFATRLEQLDESKLMEDFIDSKYGSYFHNLHGIIEHTHYHLGQIVIIKKLLHATKG